MRIGIGILSYNRPAALGQCLNSLFANLQYTPTVAVSFDHWDETFAALVRRFPLWGIRGTHRGVPAANNRLLKFFVDYDAVFLVQDDVCFLRPEWLVLYLRGLDAAPYLSFFDPYYPESPQRPQHFKVNFYGRSRNVIRRGVSLRLCHKSPMGAFQAIGRSCLEKVGYFDPRLRLFGAEHCDYWMRTCNAGFSPPDHFYDLPQAAELLTIDWSQPPSLTTDERNEAYAQSADWRRLLYQPGGEGYRRTWVPADDSDVLEIVQPGPEPRPVEHTPPSESDCLDRAHWVHPLRLPVIAYHAVEDAADDPYAVSPDQFRRHLDALAREFRLLTAGEIVAAWLAEGRLPENAAVLTLDDGYHDLRYVAGMLAERGICATMFVPAQWVGRENAWDHGAHRSRRHAGWQELREVLQMGHEIGSHGLRHYRLTRLGPDEAAHELARSRVVLEKRLEARIRTLAYPFGSADEAITQIAAKHYDAAFVAGRGGAFDWDEGRFSIRRITVEPDDDTFALFRKIAAYMTESPLKAPVWKGY